MNEAEFAKTMLEYSELSQRLACIEKEIADHVAAIGKTQTVDNVRASYIEGQTTYDYMKMANTAADLLHESGTIAARISAYTVPETNWKGLYQELDPFQKINPVIKSQSKPSVKIKILEGVI